MNPATAQRRPDVATRRGLTASRVEATQRNLRMPVANGRALGTRVDRLRVDHQRAGGRLARGRQGLTMRRPEAPGAMRAIHGPERGTSIVELLIGIAIGLFIAAGATLLLTSQIGDTRRLLLEAQVQQDLRAAADLMSRDLRRAGYWGNAYRHVWAQTAADVSNPYQDATSLGTTGLVYSRSIDEETGPLGVDAGVVSASERIGFRLNTTDHMIETLIGGSWQALTDREVLRVTQFELRLHTQNVALPCGAPCPASGPGGCPLVQHSRYVTLVISAQAVHDATVQRSLSNTIGLRNDVVALSCSP